MIKNILVLLLTSSAAIAADYAVPTENQADWEAGVSVGVVGGIAQYRAGGVNARGAEGGYNTIDVTQAPYNAAGDGVTDDSLAINNAIAAATAGDVVYFPAGNYLTVTGIRVEANNDEITLRGDGPSLTTITTEDSLGYGIYLAGPESAWLQKERVVTGTKTKGTATLTVSDTNDRFDVGTMLEVVVGNEEDTTRIQAGAVPAWSTSGQPDVRTHVAMITAKTATTLTIDPPLLYDCTDYSLRLYNQGSSTYNAVRKVGIEDLRVDGSDLNLKGVYIRKGYECWLYNVESINSDSFSLQMNRCYKCQIEKSLFGVRASNGPGGAGIIHNKSTKSLIVDNIIKDVTPFTEENDGSWNNVWAYNLGVERESGGNTFMVNHAPFNTHNLYEGNVGHSYKSDGYFGGQAYDTFYRNWLHGSDDTGGVDGTSAHLKRLTRNNVHAGNVFGWDGESTANLAYGFPNIGNSGFTGTAEPTTGDFWDDWKITGTLKTRTGDKEGVFTVSGGNWVVGNVPDAGAALLVSVWWNSRGDEMFSGTVTAINGSDITILFAEANQESKVLPAESTAMEVFMSTAGYQEIDLDVENSTTNTHNYMGLVSGTGAVTNSTADTLPDSLTYTSQPEWWDDDYALAYPPVDPDSPTFSLGIIPAGARYLGLPTASGGTMSATGATADTININQ